MKRKTSGATLLKKRVRKVQRRAKFVGFLYLLGTIVLAAIACMPLLTGTCLGDMPVTTFYQPILDIFGAEEGFALTAATITDLIVVVLFAAMLLTLIINVIRSFAKLGWLFKRRASYAYGFNRNMHAMDDMAKRFSNSLYTLVMINVFIYLLSGGVSSAVELTMFAYIALGVGFGLHFICGLLGGKVTLFLLSTRNRVEEETRENGLFVFFVRNVIQIAVVAALTYFLLQESVLVEAVAAIGDVLAGEALDVMGLVPAVIEVLAWIFIAVLAGHAIAPTEFSRDGVLGSGMRNFGIFSFLATIMLAVIALSPMLGLVEVEVVDEEKVMIIMNALIAAIVAFVGFLLDCIIRPRDRYCDFDYDEVDVEAYFQNGEQRYAYRAEDQRYNYRADEQRYNYPIF